VQNKRGKGSKWTGGRRISEVLESGINEKINNIDCYFTRANEQKKRIFNGTANRKSH